MWLPLARAGLQQWLQYGYSWAMTKTEQETEAAQHCKNCGLAVEIHEGSWSHADGHVACPPAYGTAAEPERN